MEQDLTFQQIEESVQRTEVDLESGLGQTHQALQDAASARKVKRRIAHVSLIILSQRINLPLPSQQLALRKNG
jgi:t-SNARE complex subunit (syntaxin)